MLAALTAAPAFVFGSSIGAVVALELTTRHPEIVRTVVAHEPPVAALLTEPARSQLRHAQRDIEDTHNRAGVMAAMTLFARLIELDPSDREPGIQPTTPGPQRGANLTFFLTCDAPSVRQYQPDEDALRRHADKIIPATGVATTGQIPQCTAALAKLLGVGVADFPGGHTAPTTRPHAVA